MSTKKPSFTIEEREAIGARLKKLRQSQGHDGLLQTEMAERIGVTASHYTKIERGRNFISDRLLRDVAREFGVSYEWLAYGDGPQVPVSGELMEEPERYSVAAPGCKPEPTPDLAAIAKAVLADDAIGKATKVAEILGIDREQALAMVLATVTKAGGGR